MGRTPLCGDAPLYLIPNTNIPESKAHWRVSNIIKNKMWDLSQIKHLLSSPIFDLIMSIPLSTIATREDSLRWTLDKSGSFSIKSAYNFSYVARPSVCIIYSSLLEKPMENQCTLQYKMLLWNLCHSIYTYFC